MLSDAQIRAAKPKDRSYKLFDAHQLFLLVTTGGSKLWRLNYKYESKQKSLALGRYPSLGLAEARRLRDEALAKLQEGHDPSVAKKLKLKATIEASRNTFEKVARECHEINAPQWAQVHAADVLRSFEGDVLTAIGSLPITALTPPKLLKVLRAVEAFSHRDGEAPAPTQRAHIHQRQLCYLTRYDLLASSLLGIVHLAAARYWLKSVYVA